MSYHLSMLPMTEDRVDTKSSSFADGSSSQKLKAGDLILSVTSSDHQQAVLAVLVCPCRHLSILEYELGILSCQGAVKR